MNDVDEMCEKFTKCFLKIAQECIPTKIITIRNNDRPWFNNGIRKEIRIRDRFRKTVLKFHREKDIDETIWVEVHAKGHSFLLSNTNRPEWTDF